MAIQIARTNPTKRTATSPPPPPTTSPPPQRHQTQTAQSSVTATNSSSSASQTPPPAFTGPGDAMTIPTARTILTKRTATPPQPPPPLPPPPRLLQPPQQQQQLLQNPARPAPRVRRTSSIASRIRKTSASPSLRDVTGTLTARESLTRRTVGRTASIQRTKQVVPVSQLVLYRAHPNHLHQNLPSGEVRGWGGGVGVGCWGVGGRCSPETIRVLLLWSFGILVLVARHKFSVYSSLCK